MHVARTAGWAAAWGIAAYAVFDLIVVGVWPSYSIVRAYVGLILSPCWFEIPGVLGSIAVVIFVLSRRGHARALWWLGFCLGNVVVPGACLALWIAVPGISNHILVCGVSRAGMLGLVALAVPRPRPPAGFCQICEYDLRGSASGRCPECGTLRHAPAVLPVQMTQRPSDHAE